MCCNSWNSARIATELTAPPRQTKPAATTPVRTAADPTALPTPPGPRSPALWQTQRFIRDPLRFLDDCSARYGGCVQIHLLGFGPTFWVTNPAAIHAVYASDDLLPMREAANLVVPIFGSRSITSLDGPAHLHRRRQFLPSFSGSVLEDYAVLTRRSTREEIAEWREGAVVGLHDALYRITLDVVIRLLLGAELERERRRRVADLTLAMMSRLGLLALGERVRRDLGPVSPWGRFVRIRQQLDTILYEEIAKRRAAPGDDLLSRLIEFDDENGDRLDDTAIRDEMMTILGAGSETTATAVAWTIDFLLRDPQLNEAVLSEARAGRSKLADTVVKEAMRLRSPVISSGRVAARDLEISGYSVPRGTRVWVPINVIHRDPAVHRDPERFDPSRYDDPNLTAYSWLSFGGGVRRCAGAGFAIRSTRELLQELLLSCELTLVRARPERPRARGAIVIPGAGVPVRWTPRSDQAAANGAPNDATGRFRAAGEGAGSPDAVRSITRTNASTTSGSN